MNDIKSIAALVADNIRQLDAEEHQSATIKSGFDYFDNRFGGFRKGEFVVVGGRPAMGKTQFLVNIALNIAKSFPTLFASLDMSEHALTNRFISSVSGVPAHNILHNDLNEAQKNRLYAIGNEFVDLRLFIYDSRNNNIETLKTMCQQQIQERGIQVVMVDYLQLITSPHHKKYRELEVSHISRELKNMAKENNVCVIATSQLNRAVENRLHKSPQLSDLRDSGAIEQDADKVIFIYRPEFYGYVEDCEGNSLVNQAEIIVAKNRNGRLGSLFLLRDKDFTKFRNNEFFNFSSERLNELEGITPF